MPLLPKNVGNIPQSDRDLLKKVIQHSAYVLAIYQKRNNDLKKRGVAYVTAQDDRREQNVRFLDEFNLSSKASGLEIDPTVINGVQNRKFIKDSACKTTTWQHMSEMKRKSCLQSLNNEHAGGRRKGRTFSVHNSIMAGLQKISTKSTPNKRLRNGMRSPLSMTDSKDFPVVEEDPSRAYNDFLKPKENELPPQAFLKQDYYPTSAGTEKAEPEVEQKAHDLLEKDLQMLTAQLEEEFLHEFIRRKDPEKVRQEKERNMKMKKSTLQASFKCEEEEDTDAFN